MMEKQPGAVGGGPSPTAAAVASLAAAECDRKVRCNDIGPDKSFKTRDECITKTTADKAASFNPRVCTHGINETNLNNCVKTIQSQACGNFGDAMKQAEACKTDAICVK
jgi:hypothetical protein